MRLPIALICFSIFNSWVAISQRSEDYRTITEDGSWCWFTDPRAIYLEGTTPQIIWGYVTSQGKVAVAAQNCINGEINTHTIVEYLQIDDHVNPSLLILPDDRIMVFFTRHNGTFYYTTSIQPASINSFEPLDSLELGEGLCYTNPVMLSEENNKIYVFFRGGHDSKPTFITSEDLGVSWSVPQQLVTGVSESSVNRPYLKVASDGYSTIHFAFTDGHPRDENHNSIYYLRYENGEFSDASGKSYGTMETLPINQSTVTKVYDGVAQNARAWIWDLAINEDHNPTLVFTTLPEETQHFYHYASWNGTQWNQKRLTPAGSAFPRLERLKEERNPEPHYSGGIALDPTDPSQIYLSKPINNRFEIQHWTAQDQGKSFTYQPLTSHSLHDNVRPFVIRNLPADFSNRVLWLSIDHYSHYTAYKTAIKNNQLADRFDSAITTQNIKEVMKAVAQWQINHFNLVPHHPLDWTNGALYAGMMEWAKIDDGAAALEFLQQIGRRYGWQPHKKMYHADDLVVAQMYLEMYQKYQNRSDSYRILGPTLSRLNYVIDHPSNGDLWIDYSNPQSLERWSWCDALFMAPPVYAKMANITGENRFLAFMDREFKATYDFLYDSEAHLFYRDHRYFPEKGLEANGEKIFWGRGNGWVMGGLVRILNELPAEDTTYRPFYERLFIEMAEKVASIQGEEGYWHASLLDPESYPNPEASASGFFCYALAYGINAGLLDREKYLPAVIKCWEQLVSFVFADGKLGWIQPIGEKPKEVTADMTEVYGVGAFLLAGSEMLQLTED